MRFAPVSDWREALPFETPIILSEVVPGEDTRCFACGPESELLPRTELWAYKHRHPNHHHGYARFYCAAHVPAAVRAPVAPSAPAKASRTPRVSAPRRPAVLDRVRPVCPDCFIEVPDTGVCGNCGTRVA